MTVESPKKKMKLIINPNSQRLKVSLLQSSIINKFESGGYELDVYRTIGGGDAIEVAREAARSNNYDIVVAGGGDGTVNEVINGLMPNPIQMGILPLGTSNGLARELNIPLNPLKSAEAIIEGTSVKVDVGVANGRYFGIMLGCGFDALAVEETNLKLKKFAGKYAYVIAAIKNLYKYKSHRINLIVDGERLDDDATFVVVSNTRRYAGKYSLTPKALYDDGIFDIFMYTKDSLFSFIIFAFKVVLFKEFETPDAKLFRAKNLLIFSSDRVPYHVDGDPFGELPVQVQIFPSALEILGTNPKIDHEDKVDENEI